MPLYRYRARDAQSAMREGVVEAPDEGTAVQEVLKLGCVPIEILAQQGATSKRPRRVTVGPAERMLLLQELATLLQAGVSLSEALPSMAEAYGGTAVEGALIELERKVRGGEGMASAIAAPALGMPPYVIALAHAGEASGELADALRDAAEQLDLDAKAQRELRTALIYPSILVGAGVVAVLFILTVVVPRFATLLKGSRADLPMLSKWVIQSGVFVQANAGALAIGTLALLGALTLVFSQARARATVWRWLAGLPLIGPWLRQIDLGRWTTVLGSLLSNRVPIIDALELSQAVLRVPVLRRDLAGAIPALSRGRALTEVLSEFAWFPRTRLNLIRVGERSGELPRLLTQLGRMETEAAQVQQKRVLALIEPVAILGIGIAIGTIMVGVLLAITSLNTSV